MLSAKFRANRWAAWGVVVLGTGGTGTGALAGDFNGDGYDDVVVGAPYEDLDVANAGSVTVIPGSSGGLVPGASVQFNLNTPGVPGTAAAQDRFGFALAVGNYNGDSYADLAVGVPGRIIGGDVNAGEVVIFFGNGGGLSVSGCQVFHQDSSGVLDSAEAGDNFGRVMISGDFDNDGYDDLAVGIPYEDVGTVENAGAVAILYGSAAGITATGDRFYTQDYTGIDNAAEEDDFFGFSLAVGDFQNDGHDDLAVGVPYEDLGDPDQGAAHVILGSAAGLTTTGSQFWSEDSAGIAGVGEADDHFGWSMVCGAFGYDAADDLVIGVPYEDNTKQAAGAFNAIYGSAGTGLKSLNNKQITQDSFGWLETADDLFGWALAAGDVDGDSRDDLIVGCPYKNAYPGVIDAGSVFRFDSADDGLPGLGWGDFDQDSNGIQGVAEAGDHFGYTVAVSAAGKSINGDKYADIIIGIPHEEGGANNCGYIAVVRGYGGGWTPTGDQLLNEDSTGMPGTAEPDDQWGVAAQGR